jgi:hypothetical protein
MEKDTIRDLVKTFEPGDPMTSHGLGLVGAVSSQNPQELARMKRTMSEHIGRSISQLVFDFSDELVRRMGLSGDHAIDLAEQYIAKKEQYRENMKKMVTRIREEDENL